MTIYGASVGMKRLLDFESKLALISGKPMDADELRKEIGELVPEDLSDRRNLERLYEINEEMNRYQRMYQIASEHFAELAEEMRAGVAILFNGMILFANPKLLEIFGADRLEQVLGRPSGDFMLREDWKDLNDDADREVDNVTIKKMDGTEVFVECTRRRLSYDADARLTVIRVEQDS